MIEIGHADRLVHAVEHFGRDAMLALGDVHLRHIARRAADAQRLAFDVPFDDLSARKAPRPLVVGVADAVLRLVEFGLALDMREAALQHHWNVLGMNHVAQPDVVVERLFVSPAEALVDADAVHRVGAHVDIPEFVA